MDGTWGPVWQSLHTPEWRVSNDLHNNDNNCSKNTHIWQKWSTSVCPMPQVVIWRPDVGNLHVGRLAVPWHPSGRAVQTAERRPSNGQTLQLHTRTVSRRFFSCTFHCELRHLRPSTWAKLSSVTLKNMFTQMKMNVPVCSLLSFLFPCGKCWRQGLLFLTF